MVTNSSALSPLAPFSFHDTASCPSFAPPFVDIDTSTLTSMPFLFPRSCDATGQDACSNSGSLSVKNTFIHMDKGQVDSDDSDDAPALPVKSISAPSIRGSHVANAWSNSEAWFDRTPKDAWHGAEPLRIEFDRTPKVTFEMVPSIFEINEKAECTPDIAAEYLESDIAGTIELPQYAVKNTFIHLEKLLDEDPEGDLPTRSISLPTMFDSALSPVASPAKVCLDSLTTDMHASIVECLPCVSSEPAKVSSEPGTPYNRILLTPPGLPILPAGLKFEAAPNKTSSFEHESWDTPHIDCGSASFADFFAMEGRYVAEAYEGDEKESDGTSSNHEQTAEHAKPQLDPNTAALEARALPSAGAILHGTGRCKPCAWFWKPGSCNWGVECGHCHMCPEGELRNRKKARVAQLKAEKAEQIAVPCLQ